MCRSVASSFALKPAMAQRSTAAALIDSTCRWSSWNEALWSDRVADPIAHAGGRATPPDPNIRGGQLPKYPPPAGWVLSPNANTLGAPFPLITVFLPPTYVW